MYFSIRCSVTDNGCRDPLVKDERISIISAYTGKPIQFTTGNTETMNPCETIKFCILAMPESSK